MPSSGNTDQLNLLADLEMQGVRYIRLTWIDLVNILRNRIIPVKYFKKLLVSHQGITLISATMGVAFMHVVDSFNPAIDYTYIPDMHSARLLGFADGHASVMGWLRYKDPVDVENLSASACSRNLLLRTVESAKQSHSIEFLMGFETEVVFLKSTSSMEPINNYAWSESRAISAGTTETTVLEEIGDALQKSGIELEMYHSEGAPGQFEFVTGPLPPLESVDALIATREIIYNIANKHGIRATLAPRVFADSFGTGAHVHMSLRSSRPSSSARSTSAPPFTDLEASFLQGLLDHLPAITAFSLPTPASYSRMVDGLWCGGTWAAWGKNNRECPVRLCGSSKDPHFEIRQLDGTANPYLAISAILSAGMLGVRQCAKLVVRDCQGMVASMSESERAALGVTKRLPLTLEEARKYLKEDRELVRELGEELVTQFLEVNEKMAECLEFSTPEANLNRLIETF